ncbi:MAG TPA: S8 family serine peptidase [Nitrososphaeraceae archaeon]|nr:S8 family serine peptidase [Nitrososphaeraceae archaeon]
MTDKAFITKRGSARNQDTFSLENEAAQKYGFVPLMSYEHGTIIDKGTPDEYKKLEKEGYRVKIIPKAEILDIQAAGYYIDTEKGLPDIPSELQIPESLKDSWSHHIVKLLTRPPLQWINEIEKKGVKVLETISQNFLFVVGSSKEVAKLKNFNFVEDTFPFQPAYRINKNLSEIKGKIRYLRIDLYPPSEIESVKKVIQELGGKIVLGGIPTEGRPREYAKLIVEVDSKHLSTIACIPAIRSLEFASDKPGLDGERETQILAHNLTSSRPIPGYRAWLSQIGLNGAGVTIAICDTGVDLNADNNTNGHLDVRGRQVAFVDYTNGQIIRDTDGHGTHVAGISVGNAATEMVEDGSDNFFWGQGVAPDAKYVTQNALFMTPWPPSTWAILTKDAVQHGAQVMNNSWWDGGPPGSGYTASTRRWDMLSCDPTDSLLPDQQPFCIIFSAGNRGDIGSKSITPPHEAKNPIIVGNSLTYRPGVSDQRWPDDITGINPSSSRGPAVDGRIKPDVVATGTDVSAALSSSANRSPIPNTSEKYVYLTGTSMAAPHVAGACALFIQLWKKRNDGKIPSLALIKAALINSAVSLVGGPSGREDENGQPIALDHIPNNDQGWGRVNLTNLLKSEGAESRIYMDQDKPFTSTGQEHVIRVSSVEKTLPLKITMCYSDVPGATGANPALVNDLDLEVQEISTGDIYKGNVFKNGFSATGGDFDNINNVECVYIEKPSGQYEIRIIASIIEANARPPFDNSTPWQDYAVVIDNATKTQ